MLQPEMGDDAKKAILARRAGFIAAAMAGLAAEGCGKSELTRDPDAQVTPVPCLSMPPQPCLTVAPPNPSPPPTLEHKALPDGGTDCRVPYYVDERGDRHYRRECL